jgi:hypothetical protein
VTLNVDGLPGYIDATPLGMGVLPLNVEGPGEKYTPVVGYVREDGWTPLGDHSPLSAVFGFVSL